MRKGLAAAGVVAVIAAGSAACGTATPTTPEGKVKNAFGKVGEQKSVTLGLHFSGSADQIYAAMKGEDDFTKADATMLAGLRVAMSLGSDKALKDVQEGDKAGSIGFQLSNGADGKQNLIEVRSVKQKLYVRANLKALTKLDTSGSDSSDVAELNQFLADADKLPSSLGSVKAALKGQWITIDPKAFTDFASSMLKNMGNLGGTSGSGTAKIPGLPGTKGLDAKTQHQVLTALENAFQRDAKVTDAGNHDGADHLKVTVPARQFTKDVTSAVGPLLKDLPGTSAGMLKSLTDPESLKDVPNRTIAVDLALKGGELSAITFDVAQLDTQAKGTLPLVLSVDGGADPVSAPAGAKQLNPQDLVGLVMSGLGGNGSKSSGSSSMPDLGSLFGSSSADSGSSSAASSDGSDGTDTGFFSYTPMPTSYTG